MNLINTCLQQSAAAVVYVCVDTLQVQDRD